VKLELRRQTTILDGPVETPSFIPAAALTTKAQASLKNIVESMTPNDSKIQEDNVDG